MDTIIAKIFWSGRSQAVRLPKSFRFKGEKVRIRRHGQAVILEPVAEDWQWLDQLATEFDDDFVRATEEELPSQARPDADEFFN